MGCISPGKQFQKKLLRVTANLIIEECSLHHQGVQQRQRARIRCYVLQRLFQSCFSPCCISILVTVWQRPRQKLPPSSLPTQQHTDWYTSTTQSLSTKTINLRIKTPWDSQHYHHKLSTKASAGSNTAAHTSTASRSLQECIEHPDVSVSVLNTFTS